MRIKVIVENEGAGVRPPPASFVARARSEQSDARGHRTTARAMATPEPGAKPPTAMKVRRRAAPRLEIRPRAERPPPPRRRSPRHHPLPSAQAPSEVQAKSVGEVVLAWNQELETRTVRRTPRHPDPASPPLPSPSRAAHPALAAPPPPPAGPRLVPSRAAQNYFASKAKGLAEWDSHILRNRHQLMALQVRRPTNHPPRLPRAPRSEP